MIAASSPCSATYAAYSLTRIVRCEGCSSGLVRPTTRAADATVTHFGGRAVEIARGGGPPDRRLHAEALMPILARATAAAFIISTTSGGLAKMTRSQFGRPACNIKHSQRASVTAGRTITGASSSAERLRELGVTGDVVKYKFGDGRFPSGLGPAGPPHGAHDEGPVPVGEQLYMLGEQPDENRI